MIIEDGKLKTDEETMEEYRNDSHKETIHIFPKIELEEWENYFNMDNDK